MSITSNANAQDSYQCMPCPAGTYFSNGKCVPCPDYYWSDPGSTECGRMRGDLYYFWSVWERHVPVLAGSSLTCNNNNFSDPMEHKTKNCTFGGIGFDFMRVGWPFNFNCKKLPCELPTGYAGHRLRITTTGMIEGNYGNGDWFGIGRIYW